MDTKGLKTELLCLGARVSASGVEKGRKGGAGPAAGGMFLFGGTVANVPTQSWFVSQSPYRVYNDAGRYVLERDGTRITEVTFPVARFQQLKTRDGIPYYKIALLHGADCLLSLIHI